MASSQLLISEGKKGVSSTVPTKPQQHKSLFLTCCCNKLLDDVLCGSSVALIIAPLCVWLLVAARCPRPPYAPHFLDQKYYAHPRRKQFTWRRNVSAFSLLVLRTTLILNLVQILVFGRHMTINMMILNTLIFALGLCGVRLSRARGGDIVSGTCSTTTGRHGAQPQLDEDNLLGVDSSCSCSSQGLEQQVRRTADVPRPDLRDSAPACAAASSSPPCKNNATESAVDTAANPRRSANDHEEPALLKAGEIIPPSPAKMAHAWIIDTGVTCHVTGDRELLRDLRPSVLSEQLLMASGLHLPVVGTGSIQTDRITLLNVRYAPGLLVNLISVAQLCGEHSLVMIFEPDVLYIKKTASAEIIGQASLDGSGLYVLDYLHLTGTSTGSHPHLDAEADIVRGGTCSTTTGRHGGQPQRDEETSLGVDSGCSYSSQDLEQQVERTANVPRLDLRDSAPACAAASSSPPCKNNASESAVDTAANPRRSANDHEEPALPKGGEIIPPSPAKTAHGWVVNVGAPCHVTGDRELLCDLHPSVLPERLLMVSEQRLPVVGTGSVQTDRITLPNVLYVPGLQMNLISVVQLCDEHSLVVSFQHNALYIKKTASAEISGQASLDDDSGLYVLDYLHLTGTACRTSTGSHPHLDAEGEPCGIDSGHSSSQSTGTCTAQQAMPAYACSTMDDDQMPVALTAPTSTQTGGFPEVFLDSGASFHITGFGEALQNPEHKPMYIDASSSTQAGGDLEVVLDSSCSFHMTGCGEVLQNREDITGIPPVVGISGTPLPVTGQGSIMGTPVLPIWLDKVRYVQGLPRLIVSVCQLTRLAWAKWLVICTRSTSSSMTDMGKWKFPSDDYKA